LPVLTAGRDAIHAGWKLLHHPLYGNFRPTQQPYRSLLLTYDRPRSSDGDGRITTDAVSLHLIEEALTVYRSVPVLTPEKAPAALRDACSFLDLELMRLPLQQAGWPADCLADGFGRSA